MPSNAAPRNKPVSLTLHRNTEWKRQMHAISMEMVTQARTISSQKGVAGYVMVAWNRAGKTTVACNLTQDIVPPRVVPAYVMQELQDRLLRRVQPDEVSPDPA